MQAVALGWTHKRGLIIVMAMRFQQGARTEALEGNEKDVVKAYPACVRRVCTKTVARTWTSNVHDSSCHIDTMRGYPDSRRDDGRNTCLRRLSYEDQKIEIEDQ